MASSAQRKAPAGKTLDVLKRDSADVRESARDVHRATEKVESHAERTTRLAADRTVLAAERTMRPGCAPVCSRWRAASAGVRC